MFLKGYTNRWYLFYRKAKEFIRTFHSKGSVKSLNDQAKTVLCLDLATCHAGINFDKVVQ